MTMRTTSRSVTFRHPFILGGFDTALAAGTYVVEVEEEAIESVSFPAYRRISTQMKVSALGGTEYRSIDPAELDEALLRDRVEQGPPSGTASPAVKNLQSVKAKNA